MTGSEIVDKYNINLLDFTNFLRQNNLKYSETFFGGVTVQDSVIEEYIQKYFADRMPEKRVLSDVQMQEIQLQKLEDAKKKKAMASMLITSGFNFDGYRITKYSGYISGDDAMSVDRGYAWQNISVRDGLMASLSQIRRNALRELKEAAYDLGCNAVIGVDFDYITLDPQTANFSGGTTYQPYVFCVTANGNAVVIEKIEE